MNAFSLWKPEAVKVTKGAEHVGEYNKTEVSFRQFCKLCGGHLLARHLWRDAARRTWAFLSASSRWW